MEDIKAIDVMNYPFTPEARSRGHEEIEFQIQAKLFKGGLKLDMRGKTPKDFVAEMDEVGYDKVCVSTPKMFSYRNRKLIQDFTHEEVYNMTREYPNRIIGLAGYNPLRIEESLGEVRKAITQYGFKGVYFHSLGFNLPLNDKKYYPLYALCTELSVPVQMQTGHSMEIMPSEVGRPIYIDEVALDFPNLKLVLSHTGWPWVEELIAMAWKHENVYCDISAHLPRYLDASLIRNMDGRMQDKVLFGTNGLGLKVCKEQFMQMPLKDETKRKVLRENAIKVYNLK